MTPLHSRSTDSAATVAPFDSEAHAPGEALFRAAILDGLGDAVVATDANARVVYWNGKASELFGWSADEVVGSDVIELIAADGVADDGVKILRHLLRGGAWSGEFFLRNRAGEAFPAHVTTSPIRGAGDRIIGAVGICRDMSAQRDTERALRESEERLELVHRAAASVIWEWDLRSDQVRWNDAIADAFGYAPDEVEETVDWWEDRLHPDDRERVTTGLWETLSGGRRFWTDEYRFLTNSGQYATVFDRAYVARDEAGRPARVVGTILDLTERRRAHEAARFLAQSSMLLDLSLDYGSTLPNIARLAVNSVAGFCLLAVVSPDDTVEQVVGVHQDPRRQPALDRLCRRMATGTATGTVADRVLRTGDSILMAEVPGPAGDSGDRPGVRDAALELAASLVAAPLTARGQTLGVVLMGRHDAASRYREEDLRVTEELGRRAGLAIDNARLFHSAALANRAKTDFLSVVSHELRTPLTAVMGYADLLAAEIGGALNDVQRRQVERIQAGSGQLLRMIEGILAYTRLEAGGQGLQLEWLRLDPLLERVREIVEPLATEHGVEFRVVRHEAVPDRICTDADKLVQVLLSMLTNAVKFSENGPVELCIGLADGELTLDVRDSGPGIAPEHLPQVFNPFWQAEQPEVRRAGGAGLGLSVARRLARLLHGDVVVAASSPSGTTVRCRIPHRSPS